MPVPACAEEALAELAARGNLLECLAAVPDPRDPRGIRHSLPCVPALCTAAVLCGNTAIEDVTAWVHAAPQEVLAAAGARREALETRVAPYPETVVRIFTALGAQALAGHAGAYLARRAVPAPWAFPRPGRAGCPRSRRTGRRRGAAGEDGLIPYLLAAATAAAKPRPWPASMAEEAEAAGPTAPCSVVVCRAGHTGTRGGRTHTRARAGGFHGRDRPPGARAWMPADTNLDGVRCLPLYSSG